MNYEELKKAALQALGLTFAVGLGVALFVGAGDYRIGGTYHGNIYGGNLCNAVTFTQFTFLVCYS